MLDYMNKNTVKNSLVNNYKRELWMKEILKCQEELSATTNSNNYYVSAYRDTEIQYWMHVPKWIFEEMKDKEVKRCLDIGGAYGTLALFCKNVFDCEVYVTDFVETYFNKPVLKKHNILYTKNNIELDPIPWDLKFDVIILTEVLEHFNFFSVPTLKKIHSLLSDNGHLYLSTPDAFQWGKNTKYYDSLAVIPSPNKPEKKSLIDDHVWHFNKNELLYVLDEAGFEVKKFDYSPGVVSRHFNLSLVKKSYTMTMKQLKDEQKIKSNMINQLKQEITDNINMIKQLKSELSTKSEITKRS